MTYDCWPMTYGFHKLYILMFWATFTVRLLLLFTDWMIISNLCYQLYQSYRALKDWKTISVLLKLTSSSKGCVDKKVHCGVQRDERVRQMLQHWEPFWPRWKFSAILKSFSYKVNSNRICTLVLGEQKVQYLYQAQVIHNLKYPQYEDDFL